MGTSGTKGQDSFRGAGIAPCPQASAGRTRLGPSAPLLPYYCSFVRAASLPLPAPSPAHPAFFLWEERIKASQRLQRKAFLLPFLRFLEFKK